MDKVILGYFQSLFTSSRQSRDFDFLEGLKGRISEDMNEELTKTFTKKDVKIALQQINLTKAPSPDGMATIFF